MEMKTERKDIKNIKTAVIVGAGEFTGRELCGPGTIPFDLLIAADGGLASLRTTGMTPDVVIGDFDSLGYVPEAAELTEEICKCVTRREGTGAQAPSPEIFRLPVEKDDTDMAAACRIAWERGYRRLRIYGGSGSRPDHFLANLQLAACYSAYGGEVCMVTPVCTIYALTDGSRTLHAAPGTTFSVFSHQNAAQGVSITGDAQYCVSDIALDNMRALGVSNKMTGKTACVSVRKGTLLIFLYYSPEAAD